MITQPIAVDQVLVGSYSLETLTTGMYEDPLHCIREYVQNAFDAIRGARKDGPLEEGQGIIGVAIGGSTRKPSLTISDDGTGLPAADAVRTLVSIGASTKRSTVNAGFRGIGRLAGIAYCTTLRFTTTVKGEDIATVVEFDCGRMRAFMKPSAEVQDVREVIRQCSSWSSRPASVDKHGTDVEMIGLSGIGLEFVEIEKLVPYLRQVCPVDYSDRFSQATRIRQFAESVGHPIVSVEVETRFKRERTQILKAYDDSTPTADARRPSTVSDVVPLNSDELGWHGWIGKSNFRGELTDATVAGVRFRMKNIQIDGSDLIETLGSELTTGGTEGRLQRWAVGEIFITNPAVVPNARRDGFEDGAAWREIRADVKQQVAKRVVTLVRAASKSRKTLRTLATEIEGLERAVSTNGIDAPTAERLSTAITRLLGKLDPAKLSGGDPSEVGGLASRVKSAREELARRRSRPQAEPEIAEGAGEADEASEIQEGPELGDQQREMGGDARAGGGEWPADEVLDALREVMIEELGLEASDRLFAAAFNRLEG